jgi:hypothetical protein
MVQTRKPSKRSTQRARGKNKPSALNTRLVIERIDAMMLELATMRRELTALLNADARQGFAQESFDAEGKDSRDDYDMDLDWKRPVERQRGQPWHIS